MIPPAILNTALKREDESTSACFANDFVDGGHGTPRSLISSPWNQRRFFKCNRSGVHKITRPEITVQAVAESIHK
jgi:hypothetical protein